MDIAQRDERFALRLMELAQQDAERASLPEATDAHRSVAWFMIEELERYAGELLITDQTSTGMRDQARNIRMLVSRSKPDPIDVRIAA